MNLVYVDESGNTGGNLNDREQPLFLIAALVVRETCWQALERDLEQSLAIHAPEVAKIGGEVHAADLRRGTGSFRGMPVSNRVMLRDDWLEIANRHHLKLIYRSIVKKRYHQWLAATFGSGVIINPHIAAFALVARVVDEYLAALPGNELGMFISDENKEIVRGVEKSIKVLRQADGVLRLNRIVEKGFFIDSAKSRILQLCDICALSVRKKEEQKEGLSAKPIDAEGIRLVGPLIHRGNEAWVDVMKWLTEERQSIERETKEAARDKSRVD